MCIIDVTTFLKTNQNKSNDNKHYYFRQSGINYGEFPPVYAAARRAALRRNKAESCGLLSSRIASSPTQR